MKKLKYIGILFLLILFSCVDDESRYGDIDIDEIKIEGIKDYQEIEGGGKSRSFCPKSGREIDHHSGSDDKVRRKIGSFLCVV